MARNGSVGGRPSIPNGAREAASRARRDAAIRRSAGNARARNFLNTGRLGR